MADKVSNLGLTDLITGEEPRGADLENQPALIEALSKLLSEKMGIGDLFQSTPNILDFLSKGIGRGLSSGIPPLGLFNALGVSIQKRDTPLDLTFGIGQPETNQNKESPKPQYGSQEPVDITKIKDPAYREFLSKKAETKYSKEPKEIKEQETEPQISEQPDDTQMQAWDPSIVRELQKLSMPPVQQETIPEFPAPQFTPRMDISGELNKISESLPRSIEEMVGPRPEVPQYSLTKNIVEALKNFTLGLNPYEVEEQKLAQRRKEYGENIDLAKKRMQLAHDIRVKDFDARMKQNEEMRAAEEKAYATIGERDPRLAKNPRYVMGLFKDLPSDLKQELLNNAIDPTTGLFKPGAALSFGPEEKFKLLTKWRAQSLYDFGFNGTPLEAVALTLNPEKFYEHITSAVKRMDSEISRLRNSPETPENTQAYNRLMAERAAIEGKTNYFTKYQEFKLKRDEISAIQNREEQRIDKVVKDPVERDRMKNLLREDLSRQLDYLNTIYFGSDYALHARASAGKSNITAAEAKEQEKQNVVRQSPYYALIHSTSEGLANPVFGNEAMKILMEYNDIIDMARNTPKGRKEKEFMSTSPYSSAYNKMRIKGRGGIVGRGPNYKLAMERAEQAWGGMDNVPLENIAKAFGAAEDGADANMIFRLLMIGKVTK